MPLDNPFEPMIKNIGNYVSGALYGPGVIPPIGIVNYDGTELASPADMHLLAAKDAVINEIAVGMSGNLIGENTVTGAPPLQLPHSAGYPLRWLNIALSPYQDLHGYDAPWPAGGGKNLIYLPEFSADNYEQFASGMQTSIDVAHQIISCKTVPYGRTLLFLKTNFSSGNYAFSFAITSGFGGRIAIRCYDNENNILTNSDVSITGFAWNSSYNAFYRDTNSYSFVIPDTVDHFWIALGVASGDIGQDITFSELQLERGDAVTSYAPYSNICPIHGTDKLNMFVEESYDPAATPKVVITFDNTLYGGTYDAVSGVGTIDRVCVDGGTLTWSKVTGSNYKTFKATADGINYQYRVACVASSEYKAVSGYDASADEDNYVWSDDSTHLVVKDTSKAELTDEQFKSSMVGVQFVYLIATPIPFTTDGHTIHTPKGTATTWATAEDGTVDSMSAVYIQSE